MACPCPRVLVARVLWPEGSCQESRIRAANITLLLAAFLPLCVERNQSQRPSRPAHILSTTLQAWCSRLCTLKPGARRHEFPGHPNNGPVHPRGSFASWPDRGSGPPVIGYLPARPTSLSLAHLRAAHPVPQALLPASRWSWGHNWSQQLSHVENGDDSCYNAPRSIV